MKENALKIDDPDIEETERKVFCYGLFKSCQKRKWCNGCQYFKPGDPFVDKVCYCPENYEIPDEEANAFLAAFADSALNVLREEIRNAADRQRRERK